MSKRAILVVLEPQSGAAGDPLAGLRDFGGWVLMSGIVLVVIAVIVSIILWLAGKLGQQTRAQSDGMGWAVRGLVAGAILGSIGGLVLFGSGVGGTNLMPQAAQPPVVDVTKSPAKSTCTSDVTHTAENPDADAALINKLLSEQDAKSVNAAGFTTVKWYPTGPDCTSGNSTPDPCKKVTVSQMVTAGSVTRAVQSPFDPANKSACSK